MLNSLRQAAATMKPAEISRCKRDFPPATYSLKIESYTLLTEKVTEKYDSGVFEAGGYIWKLSFYPKGDKNNNGNGYISLYLAIVETEEFSSGWKVNVNYKFFVYDQIEDKYLTIQDNDGGVKRFHELKKEWGFSQLLPLETFKNSSNGYLVNDLCVLGVEVFVINKTHNCEFVHLVKTPKKIGSFTWKIKTFSKLNELCYSSKEFNAGGVTWNLSVYPQGNSFGKDKSLSFFLRMLDSKNNPTKQALYAEFKLRVLDQIKGKHFERAAESTNFCKLQTRSLGWTAFMSSEDLHDDVKGFIVKDTVIVEVVFLDIFAAELSSNNTSLQKRK